MVKLEKDRNDMGAMLKTGLRIYGVHASF